MIRSTQLSSFQIVNVESTIVFISIFLILNDLDCSINDVVGGGG